MEHVRELLQYITADPERFAFFGIAALSLFELFIRVSPTKKSTSGLERIGKIFTKIFDLLKVPNTKRDSGSLKPVGTHNGTSKKTPTKSA